MLAREARKIKLKLIKNTVPNKSGKSEKRRKIITVAKPCFASFWVYYHSVVKFSFSMHSP